MERWAWGMGAFRLFFPREGLSSCKDPGHMQRPFASLRVTGGFKVKHTFAATRLDGSGRGCFFYHTAATTLLNTWP
jgi:hypothetical protein